MRSARGSRVEGGCGRGGRRRDARRASRGTGRGRRALESRSAMVVDARAACIGSKAETSRRVGRADVASSRRTGRVAVGGGSHISREGLGIVGARTRGGARRERTARGTARRRDGEWRAEKNARRALPSCCDQQRRLLARCRARVVHPTAIESQKNARSSIGTIRPSFLISWVSSREPSIPPFLFFREPTLGEKATTDEGKQRSAPGRTPDRTSLSAPRAERRRARTLLESVSDDRSPLARSRSRVRHLTSRSATADAPDLPPPDLVRHPHPHGVRWATTRSSRS